LLIIRQKYIIVKINTYRKMKTSLFLKFSAVFMAAVILFAGSFFVRGLAKSIDFTGGRNYVVQFEKPTEPEQVRATLNGIFPARTSI
jgi:preprotein translocase subunit SecF